MTKAELLEVLAVRAREFGIEPPGEAKFESWVDKKLLAGAKPNGRQRGVAPDWAYTEDDIARAFAIIDLESCGAKRVTQLLIGLAIKGFEFSTDWFRDCLKSEGLRSIKRMRRAGWRNFVSSSENRDTYLKRAADVDPILNESGLAPPEQIALRLIESAMSGEEAPYDIRKQTAELLSNAIGIMAPDISSEGREYIEEHVKFFPALLIGILGLPDETDSGPVSKVDRATDDDLAHALEFYRKFEAEFADTPDAVEGIDSNFLAILSVPFRQIEWQPLLVILLLSAVIDAPRIFD